MMELALNLGGPADRLAREMSEREFRQWTSYAREHVLPSRRVEVYLAQIAWAVARFMGGNENATVEDFMLDFGTRRLDEEVDLDALKASIGFSPRKKA